MAVSVDRKKLVKYLKNYSKLLEAEAGRQAGLEQKVEDELLDKSLEVFELAEMIRSNSEIQFK